MNKTEKLTEAATAAWIKQKQINAENELQRIAAEKLTNEKLTEKTRQEFINTFGIEPGEVDGSQVIIGNISIFAIKGDLYDVKIRWQIGKQCSNLTKDDYEHDLVAYAWMNKLSDLGEFLELMTNQDQCRNCLSKNQIPSWKQEKTTDEKLLDALRIFIAENSYQGEI